MSDLIDRQEAIDALEESKKQYFDRRVIIGKMQDIVNNLPSAQPKIIKCKDCKNSPLKTWFSCPLSHLPFDGERWCWKGETW